MKGFIVILFCLILNSCIAEKTNDSFIPILFEKASDELLFKEYNMRGRYDSMILMTRPVFEKAVMESDTSKVLYSGAFIVQSFVFMDEIDSVGVYLDKLASFRRSSRSERIDAMLDNVSGIYAIKSELDYPKAMTYFYEMYLSASSAGDVEAQLIALNNIASIFYIKSDKYGMMYAERAYDISKNADVAPGYKLPSLISMAQMSYLYGDIDSSESYLKVADSIAENCNVYTDRALISLLYADINNAKGNIEEAERLYQEAIVLAEDSDMGVLSMIYLKYGHLSENSGALNKAISLYEQGLEASLRSSNLMFQSELSRRLSDLYFLSGDSEKSTYYTHIHYKYLDSMSVRQTEQDFNALRLSYQNMEHRNVLMNKERDLLIANRRTIVALLIAALVFIAVSLLFIIYKRQRKMYVTLVEQHQNFMKRYNVSSEVGITVDSKNHENEKNIFMKLENLMKDEKIYLKKEITLDNLAEILDTNRTYLSKAINRFSGMTFINYINMYRINEATRIISNPENNILIKELADEMGYNSVNVFSKAFQKETGLTPSQYRKVLLSGKK